MDNLYTPVNSDGVAAGPRQRRPPGTPFPVVEGEFPFELTGMSSPVTGTMFFQVLAERWVYLFTSGGAPVTGASNSNGMFLADPLPAAVLPAGTRAAIPIVVVNDNLTAPGSLTVFSSGFVGFNLYDPGQGFGNSFLAAGETKGLPAGFQAWYPRA